MNRQGRTLALALSIAAPLFAQAPPATSPTTPSPVWTITADMAAPESAYYDAASNAVFVSSINGQILEKDGNGYISRLTPEGKVVNAKWATGLNAPKGMRSVDGTLWVSDIDEVVGIDIASGRITSRVRVEGAEFLNDLATAPDGTVYRLESVAYLCGERRQVIDLRRGRRCRRAAERPARRRQSSRAWHPWARRSRRGTWRPAWRPAACRTR